MVTDVTYCTNIKFNEVIRHFKATETIFFKVRKGSVLASSLLYSLIIKATLKTPYNSLKCSNDKS